MRLVILSRDCVCWINNYTSRPDKAASGPNVKVRRNVFLTAAKNWLVLSHFHIKVNLSAYLITAGCWR